MTGSGITDAAAVIRLIRLGFGLTAEDAGRTVELIGADAFVLMVDDHGAPVATLAAWPVDQWLGGLPVPALAIAYVTSDPARRGEGWVGRLLRRVLADATSRGVGLALLHAAVPALYARFGFAPSGVSCRWRMAPGDFDAKGASSVTARWLDPFDGDLLDQTHRAQAAATQGQIARTEAMWTFALHPDGGPRADVLMLKGPDGPEGWMAIQPPRNRTLVVADMVLLTGGAARAAARHLAPHASVVDQIIWPEPPGGLLAATAASGDPEIDQWETWMARPLDVQAALMARGYPTGVTGAVNLRIGAIKSFDDLDIFYLKVDNGRATVSGIENPSCKTLVMEVMAFGPLITGFVNAATLRRIGRLVGDDDAVSFANILFSGPLPWMADRF